jgi:competence protein ComEA
MNRAILIITVASIFSASCARAERASNTPQATPSSETAPLRPCINLNTATESELMTLAGVGEAMARKIIEHREQNGPFRRPQDIIIIDGFSERKYRTISDRICV